MFLVIFTLSKFQETYVTPESMQNNGSDIQQCQLSILLYEVSYYIIDINILIVFMDKCIYFPFQSVSSVDNI